MNVFKKIDNHLSLGDRQYTYAIQYGRGGVHALVCAVNSFQHLIDTKHLEVSGLNVKKGLAYFLQWIQTIFPESVITISFSHDCFGSTAF